MKQLDDDIGGQKGEAWDRQQRGDFLWARSVELRS
jgi:hypothetical protein